MNQRIDYIDRAKGLGIILVVFFHFPYLRDICYFEVWGGYVTTFYMPLFFIISGMFYSPSKITQKMKRLMIPYLFFYLFACSIYILRSILRNQLIDWDYLLVPFYGGTKDYLNTPIWFLLALSEIMVIAYPICKYCNYKTGVLLSSLLGFIGYFSGKTTLHIPYYIDVALLNIPIFMISFYSKKIIIEKANTMLGVICLLISILIYCICPGFTNVSQNNIPMFYICFLTISIFASVGILYIIRIYLGYIGKFFSFLGKNSLIIMSTHMMLMMVPTYINKIITNTEIALSVSLCLILLLEIPIINFCNRYLKCVILPK